MSLAGFGWEISNLHNNGADVYFRVEKNMTLNSMNIDDAFMVISLSSTGFAEVLCYAVVSRGTIPTFNNSGGHAYVTLPSDQNFGSVTNYNPNYNKGYGRYRFRTKEHVKNAHYARYAFSFGR